MGDTVSDLERKNLLVSAPGALPYETISDLRLRQYKSADTTGRNTLSDFEKKYIEGLISSEALSDTIYDLRRKDYLRRRSLSDPYLATTDDLHFTLEASVGLPLVPNPTIIGTPTINSNNTLAQVTVTAPTGVSDGDFIIVFVHTQAGSQGASAAVFGWNSLYTCTSAECGNPVRWTQVYLRRYSSLDPGPWIIPISAVHATQRKISVAVALKDCVPPDNISGLLAPTGNTTTWDIPATAMDKLALLAWHGVYAAPNKGTLVSTSDTLISTGFIPVSDGSASSNWQHVISKLVAANNTASPTITTTGPVVAAQSAIGFSFDKLQPYGQTIRYASVEDMLTKTPFYWAHRGGSANWLEFSQTAFDNAVAWGAPALELSVSQTSDGVFFGLHDEFLNTTSPSAPASSNPNAMTWEQVNAYNSQNYLGVAPYLRLDTFLNRYANSGCILIIDPKHQLTTAKMNALLDQIIAGWPAGKIIAKAHASATAWSNAAHARGLPTWGYFYEGNIANIDSYVPLWDIFGYDITASASTWTTVMSKGKPTVAFLINNQADKSLALSYGAIGLQCPDVLRVIPRGLP